MLKVRDIMTRDVLTLEPETTLRSAVELFVENHVSGAPVVAGGRVVGAVSMTDILDFQASTPPMPAERPEQIEWGEWPDEPAGWESESEPPARYFSERWTDLDADVVERFETAEPAERDLLGEHVVSEVMSRNVCWVPPATDVPRAADYMKRAGIHRLFVIDEGRLAGIVTSMDIARAVAEHRLEVRRFVFPRYTGDDDRDVEL